MFPWSEKSSADAFNENEEGTSCSVNLCNLLFCGTLLRRESCVKSKHETTALKCLSSCNDGMKIKQNQDTKTNEHTPNHQRQLLVLPQVVCETNRVGALVDNAAAVRGSLLLGLLVTERLATSLNQDLVCSLAEATGSAALGVI